MTDIEHAKKYAEESISLAISMYNPKAEIIAETACLYGLTFKNERIAELEKENAELKEALKNDKVCKCSHYFNFKDLEKQLTKAKDLLLKLSTCLEGHSNNNFEYELIKEAEQFISEVEK